jgi:hypothetical protein
MVYKLVHSPLTNGKTFVIVKQTLSGFHSDVKLNNPMRKSIKHMKSKLFPGTKNIDIR